MASRRTHSGALGVGLFAAAIAYRLELQPRMRSWGSTVVERTRTLPGDELVSEAGLQVTNAVTVAAPPEEVWPRLEQVGEALPPRSHEGRGLSSFEPLRAVRLRSGEVLLVEPAGESASRLIARRRIPAGVASLAYGLAELPAFLTRRRTLLEIKAGAENLSGRPRAARARGSGSGRRSPSGPGRRR
jgi:hypothetical protein